MRFRLCVLISAALFLTACGTNSFVTALDIGVVAADAAVAFASSPGALSPPEAATGVTDAEAADNAFSQSITEVESTDPDRVKYSKVSGLLAGVVFTTVGLSSQAAAYINAIDAAITTILAQIHAA